MTATAGVVATPVADLVNIVVATFTSPDASSGVLKIKAPAGGVGQFRGLQQGAAADKYVETVCRGIGLLVYTSAFPKQMSSTTANNGFVLTCYTGASQCAVSVAAYGSATSNFTAAETEACLKDPRYMTWRAMTVKIDYAAGTPDWWRVDSYYNSAMTSFGSTWGTGLTNSAHYTTGTDNYAITGNTAYAKTFVFAYSDGTGVQLNHLSFGFTVPVTNNSKGTTGNSLVTAPSTFSLLAPDRVSDNLCLSSHLNLEGTADTSGLGDTITAWSDGYKGKTTLELDFILPGALGGWRGVCIVYYSSQYV